MAKLDQDHPHLQIIFTEDRLRSHAPHIETLQAYALRDLLGVKAGEHTDLCEPGQAAAQAGRVTSAARHARAAGVLHRFRWVKDVPLPEANADVRGNFLESGERGAAQVQHGRWVTDLRASKRNVSRLRRGGRARWKIEHATFHTLQTQGYHGEHTDGHGEQHLSVVCVMLLMLAFLVDQTQPRCCALFQAVWAKLGSKRMRWERMRALLYASAFASMRQLCEALLYGFQKSSPSVAMDSTSSPSISSATACPRTR